MGLSFGHQGNVPLLLSLNSLIHMDGKFHLDANTFVPYCIIEFYWTLFNSNFSQDRFERP